MYEIEPIRKIVKNFITEDIGYAVNIVGISEIDKKECDFRTTIPNSVFFYSGQKKLMEGINVRGR